MRLSALSALGCAWQRFFFEKRVLKEQSEDFSQRADSGARTDPAKGTEIATVLHAAQTRRAEAAPSAALPPGTPLQPAGRGRHRPPPRGHN